MQINSKYSPNKLYQNDVYFGMALDMNPRKIAQKFYPQGGAVAKRLLEEAEAAKLLLKARTKNVHAIVIPAQDYDGTPRIDICIQGLTPRYPKTLNPIKALLNWAFRKLAIKYKDPRAVGYAYFDSPDNFASRVINVTDSLKTEFFKTNEAPMPIMLELSN